MVMNHRAYLLIPFLSLFVIVSGGVCVFPADARGDESPEMESQPGPIPLDQQIRKFMEESFFQSLGISSGVVTSDDYDTGLGFGGNMSHLLIDPGLRLMSSVYFWGASKDSNDVSSFGLEESVMLEKSPHADIDIFTGLTAGYYSMEKDTLIRNGEYTNSSNTNRFNVYLTSGFRYRFMQDRSFTFHFNYNISQETNELHLIFGLEFFKPLDLSPTE